MRQAEEAKWPGAAFQRKIASLILQGRLSRAHREIQRYNAEHSQHIKVLPTDAERKAWAESVLGVRIEGAPHEN